MTPAEMTPAEYDAYVAQLAADLAPRPVVLELPARERVGFWEVGR